MATRLQPFGQHYHPNVIKHIWTTKHSNASWFARARMVLFLLLLSNPSSTKLTVTSIFAFLLTPLFFPIYQVCTEWNRCTWSDFNKKRHTHTKRTGLEFISHLWSMGNKLCPETSSRCTERLNAWTLLHLLGGSTLMSQRIQIVTCLFVFVG